MMAQNTSHPLQTSQLLNEATQRTGRLRGHRTHGQTGSPSTGPNRTGRGQRPTRIISCRWPARTTQVKEEWPKGGKDRMSAPPTDKGEGEQA